MDWQLVVVGLIVAASCVYLARQTWRSWTGRKSGCTGCSCKNPASSAGQAEGEGAAVTFIPSDQLALRRQRAQRFNPAIQLVAAEVAAAREEG